MTPAILPPRRPWPTAKVRCRMPLMMAWEDTRIAVVRDGTGHLTRIAYHVEHVWTTWGQWVRMAVDRASWFVWRVGPFVVAHRVVF